MWFRIIADVPEATLYLKARVLGDPAVRQRVLDFAATRGIEARRLRLEEWRPQETHLASYGQIDLALDPFPYNGTTTTCEALVMGIPVICLRGTSHRARVGASILTQIGRPEWIAESPEDYRAIARELAGRVVDLRIQRVALRKQVLASPLCDASGFANRFLAVLAQTSQRR